MPPFLTTSFLAELGSISRGRKMFHGLNPRRKCSEFAMPFFVLAGKSVNIDQYSMRGRSYQQVFFLKGFQGSSTRSRTAGDLVPGSTYCKKISSPWKVLDFSDLYACTWKPIKPTGIAAWCNYQTKDVFFARYRQTSQYRIPYMCMFICYFAVKLHSQSFSQFACMQLMIYLT